MNTYPMSAETAERLRDLDYVEHVQSTEERDAAYDEAAKDHATHARFILLCDDAEPIAKMLRLLAEAGTIRCGAGPMHEDYRRKLVGKMMDLHRELCNNYAEAA